MTKKQKIEYSQIDEIIDCQEFVKRFREGFDEIEDPRRQEKCDYLMVDLLLMMMCAIIAGANTITHKHANWLNMAGI